MKGRVGSGIICGVAARRAIGELGGTTGPLLSSALLAHLVRVESDGTAGGGGSRCRTSAGDDGVQRRFLLEGRLGRPDRVRVDSGRKMTPKGTFKGTPSISTKGGHLRLGGV